MPTQSVIFLQRAGMWTTNASVVMPRSIPKRVQERIGTRVRDERRKPSSGGGTAHCRQDMGRTGEANTYFGEGVVPAWVGPGTTVTA